MIFSYRDSNETQYSKSPHLRENSSELDLFTHKDDNNYWEEDDWGENDLASRIDKTEQQPDNKQTLADNKQIDKQTTETRQQIDNKQTVPIIDSRQTMTDSKQTIHNLIDNNPNLPQTHNKLHNIGQMDKLDTYEETPPGNTYYTFK